MMSSIREVHILISGVTGYIGGSILAELLEQTTKCNLDNDASHVKYIVTALVRRQEQADLFESKGIKVTILNDFADLDSCRNVAEKHDAIISAAAGQNDETALAFIRGLGDRQKATRKCCHYIHTGGTTVVGFTPVLEGVQDTPPWSDQTDFANYEKTFPKTIKQRPNRLFFFNLAEELGVKASMIVPPSIWGTGRGLFSTMSTQVATLTKAALQEGQAIVVGQGNGMWNVVHISDLSALYAQVVHNAFTAEYPPQTCVYWAEAGIMSWKATSDAIAKALFSQGLLRTNKVKSITVEQGATLLAGGDKAFSEAVYASSSVATSDRARNTLGWKPRYGQDAYWSHFEDAETFVKMYDTNA